MHINVISIFTFYLKKGNANVDVLVCAGCRSVAAGQKAVEDVRKAGVESGTAEVLELDVASLASIRAFAQQVLDKCPRINLLINNGEETNLPS